jgi:predicted LPLAT superfamily acyltransferase
MERSATVAAVPRGWLEVAEAGSILGIRWFVFLVTFVGRRAARAWLIMVVFYYALLMRGMRRASQRYLARVGRPHGFWAVYRHSMTFGQCVIDRLFFVQGRTTPFEVDRTGEDHLLQLAGERRGAILLSAHLGSFEAMRAFADEMEFPINVLVNNANALRINRVLVGLNPSIRVRMLDVSEGPDFIFKVRSLLEAGEMVAIMGDRVAPGSRAVEAPFFGQPARFPTGAYEIAAAVRCPVYLTLGLYRGDNRYSLICEPFAEKVELPRGDRQRALEHYATKYAARLEHYCREAPENWFNFFDFWQSAES